MRLLSILSLVAAISIGHGVQADDACKAEIAGMLDGGTLDPFMRPAFRQVNTVYAADGSVKHLMESIAQTPLHQISGIRGSGQYLMMINRDSWRGPTPDGPWAPSGMTLTEDMLAAQRAVSPSMAANLSEVICAGPVDVEGRSLLYYGFRTKVDPHPGRGDSWWGGMHKVYLDPETKLPMIWEITEQIASWAPEVSAERHRAELTYDPGISITAPE